MTIDQTFSENIGADCWKDFVESLPDNQCRYGIFDLELTVEDELTMYKGDKSNKLVFICWTPVKVNFLKLFAVLKVLRFFLKSTTKNRNLWSSAS